MADIAYRTADVDGLTVFYREAGAPDAPTLVLLHGFPSASHMFRELIPLLADRFHLVAPDLPGFGKSDMPARGDFGYTFEHIADVIDRLTEVLGLDRFALYVFDYGAPVGFRIATRHPERITAIISQNGNAYTEGLSDGWNPVQAYWKDPSQANREAIRMFLAPQTTIWQYTHGVPDTARVSPDGCGLDNYYLARSGADEIQLDLFLDYASNVALYPAFQEYFRTSRPPLLAVWGRNDPFFLPAGAEAFKRDIPDADIRFVDTGHFALETHVEEIADRDRRVPHPIAVTTACGAGGEREGVKWLLELVGGTGGLGWVAVKAVLMFAVTIVGLRLGERRTLAQLGAFDFAVAVAIGAIIGRTVTASSASFATGAVALVTLLVAHRLVAFARRHNRMARLIDHPPRVLVAEGKIQDRELGRAGLTAADVYALLRQQGVDDLGQVGYLLYETRGTTTLIGTDSEPGPLMRDGLSAAGYRHVAKPAERHVADTPKVPPGTWPTRYR